MELLKLCLQGHLELKCLSISLASPGPCQAPLCFPSPGWGWPGIFGQHPKERESGIEGTEWSQGTGLPCIEESIPLYVKAVEFHQGLDHLWLFTPETSDQLEVKT